MNSESILLEAEKLTNGDRQNDYGHPYYDFKRTIGMINALFEHKLKEPLTPTDFALIMNCCKMSREVNHPKRDNIVDGAGYWNCLDKIRQKEIELKEAN